MERKFYRITGPQSIARIEPLLRQSGCNTEWVPVDETAIPSEAIDLVWETCCEKTWKNSHCSAIIFNRLHNSQIFEDKSNFAFLQIRMNCATLHSHIALSKLNLTEWCLRKWETSSNSLIPDDLDNIHVDMNIELLSPTSFLGEPHNWSLPSACEGSSDWWAVKASRGNGGKDVWVFNKDNYNSLLLNLPSNEEFVVQKYIIRPLLWNKKKFHFR
jgi:hypothetical protein